MDESEEALSEVGGWKHEKKFGPVRNLSGDYLDAAHALIGVHYEIPPSSSSPSTKYPFLKSSVKDPIPHARG